MDWLWSLCPGFFSVLKAFIWKFDVGGKWNQKIASFFRFLISSNRIRVFEKNIHIQQSNSGGSPRGETRLGSLPVCQGLAEFAPKQIMKWLGVPEMIEDIVKNSGCLGRGDAGSTFSDSY